MVKRYGQLRCVRSHMLSNAKASPREGSLSCIENAPSGWKHVSALRSGHRVSDLFEALIKDSLAGHLLPEYGPFPKQTLDLLLYTEITFYEPHVGVMLGTTSDPLNRPKPDLLRPHALYTNPVRRIEDQAAQIAEFAKGYRHPVGSLKSQTTISLPSVVEFIHQLRLEPLIRLRGRESSHADVGKLEVAKVSPR